MSPSNKQKRSTDNSTTASNSVTTGNDVDNVHHEYEFGGPVGVTAMMTLFPTLFYYLYACLYFYDGKYA